MWSLILVFMTKTIVIRNTFTMFGFMNFVKKWSLEIKFLVVYSYNGENVRACQVYEGSCDQEEDCEPGSCSWSSPLWSYCYKVLGPEKGGFRIIHHTLHYQSLQLRKRVMQFRIQHQLNAYCSFQAVRLGSPHVNNNVVVDGERIVKKLYGYSMTYSSELRISYSPQTLWYLIVKLNSTSQSS